MKLRRKSRKRRLLEEPLSQHLELEHRRRGEVFALDGPPGHEPLFVGGQRADAGVEAVGDDERFVEGEERRDLLLVGLELVEGGPDGGVFVGRVLQLDDGERQAVDEEHDVRAAVVLAFDDGELVDGDEVVLLGVLEVDEPDAVAGDGAVRPLDTRPRRRRPASGERRGCCRGAWENPPGWPCETPPRGPRRGCAG